MRISWIDDGDDVRYVGPDETLAGRTGKVTRLDSGQDPSVEVDLDGDKRTLAPWHLVRAGEKEMHAHEKLAEGLHFFEWRGFENNCNAVVLEGEGTVVIDPGHAHLLGSLFSAMAGAGLDPGGFAAVLLTHGHPDHIEGAEVFHAAGASVGMNPDEWASLKGEGGMLFRFFGSEVPEMDVTIDLAPGSVEVAGLTLDVMHTPGHSPGSVCLFWPRTRALVVGDVVFPGGAFGRCDFPGGSYKILLESFVKFDGLSPEYLLSGHGPSVSGRADVSDSIQSSRSNLRTVVFSPWS
ncbi:MAG: MBL fold metallo-hydrolase [Deltaproteobacteria bacterium]|nr:MBL fold metallo-hydrolase [Deltaproteobacteria bacterium]